MHYFLWIIKLGHLMIFLLKKKKTPFQINHSLTTQTKSVIIISISTIVHLKGYLRACAI